MKNQFWKHRKIFMRYSKKHKKLFIHIPRCAGRSIVVAMKRHYGRKNVPLVPKAWTHSRLKDVRKNIDLSKYEKIAVVRNPWERMVSLYCFLKQKKAWWDTRKGKIIKIDKLPEFSDWLINYGKRSHNLRTTDIPQFDWISLDGKLAADHIIRYENLLNDVEKVFGFKDLPMTHKTEKGEWKLLYNDDSFEYVKRVFKKDVEEFKYDF